MKNKIYKIRFLRSHLVYTFLQFIIACSPADLLAQGDLLVTPKRIVFDGSVKSYIINVANTGRDTAKYLISLIHNRMKSNGSFETVTEPDSTEKIADNYLFFYPHSVVLAPNESQSVRVQIRKFGELSPGEYRTNLYFRAMPDENRQVEPGKQDQGISIKLIPIFGISMPIIIKVGESTAKVSFSDASLAIRDSMPVIQATLNRTGNMSVYGDLSVDHISPGGKVTRVSMVKGVAVYNPNNIRNFILPLRNEKSVNYHQGKLHILYYEESPKSPTLAETEINLGK